jgi:hypothetical protein
MIKRRNIGKRKAEKRKAKAHLHAKTGPSTTKEANPDPASNPPEQGSGERGQPWCARTTTIASRAHLAPAVAWRHAKAAHGGFLIYQRQNRP